MLEKTRSLQLILDLRCNSNCTLCGASWPFHPNLNTMQAVERLCHGIQIGLREVVFSGGEVTLRHDLIKLIQFARNIGYSSIIVLTNGRRLANSSYLEKLAQAGITSIGTSLHGHTAEVHEHITRAALSFEQTVEGIETVRRRLPALPLSVNCVLNEVNYRYTADIVRFLMSLDVRLVQLTYVVPVGKAKGIYFHSETPGISETLPFIRDSIDIFRSQYNELSNASVTLAFFPFCVLRDLVSFSGEASQSMSYFASESGEFVLADDEISRQDLKTKRTECALCRFDKQCDGIWQEYVAAKGWIEFTPVTEYGPEQIISSARIVQSQESQHSDPNI